MGDRGKVVEILLDRLIVFNDEPYSMARIEIDHVNFGLDPKTKKLNTKRRSHFTVDDVMEFLFELDDQEAVPVKVNGIFRFFAIEIFCPLVGHNLGQIYKLVFTINKNDPEVLEVITLYRMR